MGDVAVRVDGLGKRYQIGAARGGMEGSSGLRHTLEAGVRRTFGRMRGRIPSRPKSEEFWALKDVSFEVKRGECVGIIGRNGAGKSTLLKVLSRITEPTEGEVRLRGRVGSLLEVGTGFHPELTGRENIYLNGSVLGMSRAEVRRKFDEIVAFSEVEQFLDTPVKRYSSGMYVRLAFAVAAHLEPEILIVDEVLAVGDASFQKKCLDRMTELAKRGLTVLFVSHNLQVVARLCQSAVRLSSGQVVDSGPADAVVRGYLAAEAAGSSADDLGGRSRTGDGRAKFRRVWLTDAAGHRTVEVRSGDDLRVRFEIESKAALADVAVAVVVQNVYGLRVITSWNREVGFEVGLNEGSQVVECLFRSVPIRAGQTLVLGLWLAASSGDVLDSVDNALSIDVLPSDRWQEYSTSSEQGVVLCEHQWRVARKEGQL